MPLTAKVRSVGQVDLSGQDRIVLSGDTLHGADFRNRHLAQFSAAGVRLEDCSFDGAVIESASFGAGRVVSEYVGCSFARAKLRMMSGGYARFVGCNFEKAVIENWFCSAVELIDCTFSGRLQKVIFNGTVPKNDQQVIKRQKNEFVGNDFSRAKLVDVGFRTGIDLTKQRLPESSEYVYLDDAASAVQRAHAALKSWGDSEALKRAVSVLGVMEQDVAAGQIQLFMRADDYPRSSRPAIRTMLNAARG